MIILLYPSSMAACLCMQVLHLTKEPTISHCLERPSTSIKRHTYRGWIKFILEAKVRYGCRNTNTYKYNEFKITPQAIKLLYHVQLNIFHWGIQTWRTFPMTFEIIWMDMSYFLPRSLTIWVHNSIIFITFLACINHIFIIFICFHILPFCIACVSPC